MRRSVRLTLVPALAAVAVLGVACGSDDDSSSSTTTSPATTESTTTTSTSTTTAPSSTSTTASGPAACTSSQLQGELGPKDTGAGQVYAPLILRNTSSTSCVVRGFPGVSVLDGSGTQLGEPATREGAEGSDVLLQPGGVASSVLHTTNQGIGGPCQPASAQMRVFPPDQTEALTFDASFTVCGGFTVTSLVPGDTGTA